MLSVTSWPLDCEATQCCVQRECARADFDSVEDYYAAGGSHQRVHNVKIPLLVVQAGDDPIAPIAATPEQTLLENPHCILAGVLKCSCT
jgi:predicted alpha/beta-fold hydrolase